MDKNYIRLTEFDKNILESYKGTLDGLGLFLGEGYEIALHSLENLNKSVIKIVNGHLSGRKEGSPITDLALKLLVEIEKDNKHSALTYLNKSKNGSLMKSATIPIKGESDKIIGLICINFYTDTPLSTLISQFMPNEVEAQSTVSLTENFSENIDDLIEQALKETREIVYSDETISSTNKNKEIIALLEQKGIFNLKDGVIKVAKLQNISKNTIYMHLRNLNPKK